MPPQKALLVLTLILLLGGNAPVLARQGEVACGMALPKDPREQSIDIGDRFWVRNVRINSHPQGVLVAGEIHNDLRGFFTFALFKLQLFNADCTYLGANNFTIHDFKLGITRPFRVIVPRVQRAEVATYDIEFIP